MNSPGRRSIGLWISGACLAAMLLAPLGAAAQTKEPIKLGAVLSLTGPGAGLGQSERSATLAPRALGLAEADDVRKLVLSMLSEGPS